MDELLAIDKLRQELLIVSRNGNSNASELPMRRMLRHEVIISEICRRRSVQEDDRTAIINP